MLIQVRAQGRILMVLKRVGKNCYHKWVPLDYSSPLRPASDNDMQALCQDEGACECAVRFDGKELLWKNTRAPNGKHAWAPLASFPLNRKATWKLPSGALPHLLTFYQPGEELLELGAGKGRQGAAGKGGRGGAKGGKGVLGVAGAGCSKVQSRAPGAGLGLQQRHGSLDGQGVKMPGGGMSTMQSAPSAAQAQGPGPTGNVLAPLQAASSALWIAASAAASVASKTATGAACNGAAVGAPAAGGSDIAAFAMAFAKALLAGRGTQQQQQQKPQEQQQQQQQQQPPPPQQPQQHQQLAQPPSSAQLTNLATAGAGSGLDLLRSLAAGATSSMKGQAPSSGAAKGAQIPGGPSVNWAQLLPGLLPGCTGPMRTRPAPAPVPATNTTQNQAPAAAPGSTATAATVTAAPATAAAPAAPKEEEMQGAMGAQEGDTDMQDVLAIRFSGDGRSKDMVHPTGSTHVLSKHMAQQGRQIGGPELGGSTAPYCSSDESGITRIKHMDPAHPMELEEGMAGFVDALLMAAALEEQLEQQQGQRVVLHRTQ